MQANAIQEQAKQGLVAGVNKAVQTGDAIYQDHIQKQYGTDMIAGSAMLDQLQFKRDSDIKKIPVDSSVDYAAEVKKINESYNTQWKGWSKKNIRNQGHPTVRQLRQQSIDAFETDGATTSAKLGVQYEDARNISNIHLAQGINAGRMKVEPDNQSLVAEARGYEDALLSIGAQDEATTEAKKSAIQVNAWEMSDAQKTLSAERLAFEEKDEEAAALIDSLSELNTEEDKAEIKRETFGAGSYNRFNNQASRTTTIDGWGQYSEAVKKDPYLSPPQKYDLLQRDAAGNRAIVKSQKSVYDDLDSVAQEGGEFLVEYDRLAKVDSAEGMSTIASKVKRDALIRTSNLAKSSRQRAEDKALYSKAVVKKTGNSDVLKLNNDIYESSFEGTMSDDNLKKTLKRIDSMDVAEGIKREAEWKALQAHRGSIASDPDAYTIRRAGIERVGRQFGELSEGQKSAAVSFDEAFDDQKLELNNYIDFAETRTWGEEVIAKFGQDNPKPSASDIAEVTKTLTDYVKGKTRQEQLLRNQ